MPSAETQREAPRAEPDAASASAGNGAAGHAPSAPGEATSRDWDERCANCGARLHGRYCHDCGEKAVTADDYALSTFLRKGLATLTHLDGSAFRTFYSLLARPGFLTQEHRAGRRTRYLRPLQVFLIANVAFYLFSYFTGANMLQARLGTHLHAASSLFHAGIAERLVTQHVQDAGITLRAYAEQFNSWIGPLSKTLVLVMIPVFALLLKAVHLFQRRYYVEHLVAASHAVAFWLLAVMGLGILLQILLPPVLRSVTGYVPPFVRHGPLLSGAILLTEVAYFYVALRRRYEQSAWLTAAKSIALSIGLGVVIFMLYRALLFFVAFYATT